MRLGGCGEISVTANVVPDLTSKMCELVLEGKVEEAREIDERLASLHSALFLEANPIPVKWAVARMGLMGNAIRLPLTPLAESYRGILEQAMRDAGVTL
jgi:dihydrodipicolinate synthase (EC 4.2.1.52)